MENAFGVGINMIMRLVILTISHIFASSIQQQFYLSPLFLVFHIGAHYIDFDFERHDIIPKIAEIRHFARKCSERNIYGRRVG